MRSRVLVVLPEGTDMDGLKIAGMSVRDFQDVVFTGLRCEQGANPASIQLAVARTMVGMNFAAVYVVEDQAAISTWLQRTPCDYWQNQGVNLLTSDGDAIY